MTSGKANLDNQGSLRRKAEALVQAGSAPVSKTGAIGANALALLHSMASAPANASAALKLLHEFQVHQVELELQQEHLEHSRDELNLALERYVERFDCAPVAYLSLDREGRILEANLAAAALFGLERNAMNGRRIDTLVTTQYQLLLLGLVKRMSSGSARETCEAMVEADGVTQQVQIVATTSQNEASLMMVVIPTAAVQKA
ncbi:MAG: PAS domain S-box protein [Pseudomonadota bacterium]